MQNLDGRHPDVQDVAQWFHYEHLPREIQGVSALCHDLAEDVVDAIADDPQLIIGLQHLLIAKDAFVRAYAKQKGKAHPLATSDNHS